MNDYEAANKARFEATGGRIGMLVNLPGGPAGYPFWSHGWRGCPGCGGDAKGDVAMHAFIDRRHGVTRSGWSCSGLTQS